MRRVFCRAYALPLFALAVPALAAPPATVMVSGCWVRSMPRDIPSGGYFELMNLSDNPVDVVGVGTDAFVISMLHQSLSNGSTSKMVMVDKATVPANGTLAFAPGGYHVMFEKARKPLVVGSTIYMTFKFGDGSTVQAPCTVKDAAGD
jgi:copper(I)-binding protein